MGECSTQERMEEQLSKSWQRNKLTIQISIFLRKVCWGGCWPRSITGLLPLPPIDGQL